MVRDEVFEADVLGALVEAGGLGLFEISRRFKRSPLVVAFAMADLTSNGLAVRDGGGVFRVLPIGEAAVLASARKASAA